MVRGVVPLTQWLYACAALRAAEAELPISQDMEAAVDAQLLLAGCQAAGPAAVPWVAALALLLGDSQPLLGTPSCFAAIPPGFRLMVCDAVMALLQALMLASHSA